MAHIHFIGGEKSGGGKPRVARIINVKRLHETSMMKIDSHSSSFWSAAQSTDAHALGILDRQRVKRWLKHAYSEIDTLPV